ncbi:hypothetical protein Hanom_Chr06g00539951 [Helianthus anomalus]
MMKKWVYIGYVRAHTHDLFAYSANEFTKFAPHDICPAPQIPPIQLVCRTADSDRLAHLLLVQVSHWLDVLTVDVKRDGGVSTTDMVARVKSTGLRKIAGSSVSPSGRFLLIPVTLNLLFLS